MANFYGVDLKIEKKIVPQKDDALLVIDMQYDFIPGGSLPVAGGDQIIDGINDVIRKFVSGIVVHSQDWHPADHLSFADNHPGKNPGDEFSSKDGAIGPILWPAHCVQFSHGAQFHKRVNTKLIDKIIQKGMNTEIDSYSAFLENDKKSETGMKDYLNSMGVKNIYVCGLALDYCCYNTAIDGKNLGFDTTFIVDLTRGVDLPPGNVVNALNDMKSKKIKFATQKSFSFF